MNYLFLSWTLVYSTILWALLTLGEKGAASANIKAIRRVWVELELTSIC
jgi:hypothetical protein